MRRGDRLFEIIQLLRSASRPITAAAIADSLEVTTRTVYRDIAALQARRVPIEGAPGIGYVMRRGFDLPPLMFTTEEVEAIVVGARLVRRTGDTGLQQAAESVLSKVTVMLPDRLKNHLAAPPFLSRTSVRTHPLQLTFRKFERRSETVGRCSSPTPMNKGVPAEGSSGLLLLLTTFKQRLLRRGVSCGATIDTSAQIESSRARF